MLTINMRNHPYIYACSFGITMLGALAGFYLSDVNSALLSMTALVFILLCLCISPMLFFKNRYGVIDQFHPVVFLPLIYFVYFGLGPYLYVMRTKLEISANVVSDSMLPSLILLAIAGIAFFYIGFISGSKIIPRHEKSAFQPFEWQNQRTLFILILFSLIFFVSVNMLFWRSAGGIPLFISDYYKESKTEIMAGKGYFEFLALSIVPVALFLINWFLSLANPSRVMKRMIILLFVVTLSLLILNLVRGLFLSFIIFSIISYHYTKKRLKLQKLIVIFLGVVLLAAIAGYLRSSQWSELEWSVGNIILLESAVEFDNYAKTIEIVPDQLELQLGKTIVPLFTTPIPRALFPIKDLFMPAQVLIKEFLGHDFLRIGERITIVAELFLNFHVFGVCIGMAIYGFLAALVYRCLYPSNKNPFQVTLYVLALAAGLAYQIPGDIASVALGYIQLTIPVIALFVFFHVRNTIFNPTQN